MCYFNKLQYIHYFFMWLILLSEGKHSVITDLENIYHENITEDGDTVIVFKRSASIYTLQKTYESINSSHHTLLHLHNYVVNNILTEFALGDKLPIYPTKTEVIFF